MTQNALQPVLTPEGFQMLESPGRLGSYSPQLADKLNQGLRKRGVDPELVAAILTQLELRDEARVKFGGFADVMPLTCDGLEQATRLPVAAHHAARFRRAGCQKVVDLGCGIGAEPLAFVGVGLLVEAFETDETTAAAALLNLRAPPEAKVTQADTTKLNWKKLRKAGVDGAFADPARCDKHGRKLKPKHWKPPLDTVSAWRHEVPGENLGVKVAPGIDYQELPADAEVTWVSVGGDLVEAGIRLGDLREKPGRSVLLIGADGRVRAVLRDPSDSGKANASVRAVETLKSEDDLGDWIFEPDAAVTRAGLVARAAELAGAWLVSPGIAYLTGSGSLGVIPGKTGCDQDEVSRDASLAATMKLGTYLRIERVCAPDEKALKKTFKALGVRSLEVKKRGADISPAYLRKKILPKPNPGGKDLILIATRVAGKYRVILARRIPDSIS